jgi:hypothetical protein
MANESIIKILGELGDVVQTLRQFRDSGKMPDIEKDIALSKLQNIYGFIKNLKAETGDFSKIIEPEIPIKAVTQKEQVSEPIVPADHNKTVIAKVAEPEIVIETSKPSKTTETSAKTEILADKFRQTAFLNETLAQYGNTDNLSKKFQHQPLNDIFSAIGLNDKFLFIKTLFNNDASLYQDTIENLNSAANFNEAVSYLDEHFSWDFNEPLVQHLLNLVRRRHIE